MEVVNHSFSELSPGHLPAGQSSILCIVARFCWLEGPTGRILIDKFGKWFTLHGVHAPPTRNPGSATGTKF